MKIIHLVLGKANPLRMNGVNKLVYEMATAQTKLGAKVTVWGITKNMMHDYPERNFTTVLFPSVYNKMTINETVKRAIKAIEEPTIFHLHGSFIPEFFTISRLLVKKNIPYVYTPHGALAPAALKRRNWKKKWYFEFFEKKMIQDAKAVIATGKSVFENLDNLVESRQKVLIPNGQPKLSFEANKFKKSDPLIFSYCGRIAIEHKGLDLLFEGFSVFLNSGRNAELHIIGDGDEMPTLKKLAEKLKLNTHVKFHGAKYGDEKFQLLSESNCFVHTSRMEGFPAAVLEAAALGLPCLVSRATNIDDYIKNYNCGIVIENNTPEEIAKSMITASQILQNGSMKPLSRNAKNMIKVAFAWKEICLKLIEVYQEEKILVV